MQIASLSDLKARLSEFADRAEHEHERFRFREALVAFIFGGLAEAPARRGKPLRGELTGMWSARRGDFRVNYRIDDEAQTVHIRPVAGRPDVYRTTCRCSAEHRIFLQPGGLAERLHLRPPLDETGARGDED